MKHTPTPWNVAQTDDELTVIIESSVTYHEDAVAMELNEANAFRICACVNAMDGIDDPEQWVAVAKTHIAASEAQANQNKRLKDQLEQLGKIAHAIANYVRPLEEQVKMKRTINAILGINAGGGK